MADFKDLHSKWKDAKKSTKSFWDMLGRQTTDVTSAHTNVTYGIVKFPKFDKDLGPSLDKLQELTTKRDVKDLTAHKKDLKKYKDAAEAAIKQYETDIKGLEDSATNVKIPAKTGVSEKADKAVGLLADTVKVVKSELEKLKTALANAKSAVATVKYT